MRIVFIHGFGETAEVFDQIAPKLSGEHTYVSLWEALGNAPRRNLRISDFSQELIDKYAIVPEDLVIGHSLGGKIAHHIKQLQNNRIVQLASWTQQVRVKMPIKNPTVALRLARWGLLFNPVVKRYLMKQYRRPQSALYYESALDNLISGHSNCVVNQLRLVLEPIQLEAAKSPDLRIHARRDNIIRYPKQPFIEVPGDHFSLLTNPKEVVEAIRTIL